MTEFYDVIYRLALIQIASDAGKDIRRKELVQLVSKKDAQWARALGYKAKDQGLHALIGYLSRHHVEGVTYHMNSDPKYRWDGSLKIGSLVYFNLNHEGKRYQVSFHMPYDLAVRAMNDKSRAHWLRSTATDTIRWAVPDSAETLVLLLKALKED
ncbi:MAG: hypothetical protein Q4B32_08530 [Clostridia bacterium]|nr:hypothetical protein [Clostridia bacterium]